MTTKEEIMEVLKELCVPANIKGYRYLLYAIEMCMADNRLLKSITTELYPSIAKNFDDTTKRTERAILHAVDVSYKRCDAIIYVKYFGKRNKRVTSSQFIATIVFRLQFKEKT